MVKYYVYRELPNPLIITGDRLSEDIGFSRLSLVSKGSCRTADGK